jgi:hypothetical protein
VYYEGDELKQVKHGKTYIVRLVETRRIYITVVENLKRRDNLRDAGVRREDNT